MIRVWWKHVLCVLHRVHIHPLIYHLVVDKYLPKPFSAHRMVLLLNHIFRQPSEFLQVLMMAPILLDFIYKILLNFENSSNDLSSFQFNWTFVNSFFLILNTELRVESWFLLENIPSVVASELSVSIKEARNLWGREVTLKVRSILEHNIECSKVTSDSSVQTDVNEGNEFAVNSELRASHVICRNRRMVADFLVVNGYSFNVALESFT